MLLPKFFSIAHVFHGHAPCTSLPSQLSLLMSIDEARLLYSASLPRQWHKSQELAHSLQLHRFCCSTPVLAFMSELSKYRSGSQGNSSFSSSLPGSSLCVPSLNFGRKEKRPGVQTLQIVSLGILISALHRTWQVLEAGSDSYVFPETGTLTPVGAPPVVRCPTFVVRSYTWERCCKVRLLSEAPPASPPLLPGSLLIVSLYCKHSARADEAPYPACQSPATIHYDVFWDQISCTSHSRESSDNLNVIASSGAPQPAASSLCNRIFEVPRSPGHGHNLGCSHVGHLWLQTPTYHIRVAPNFRADARTS